MTRRLLAAVSLAALATGGLVAVAAPAGATEDSPLCIGSESQRRPGSYTYICLLDARQGGGVVPIFP